MDDNVILLGPDDPIPRLYSHDFAVQRVLSWLDEVDAYIAKNSKKPSAQDTKRHSAIARDICYKFQPIQDGFDDAEKQWKKMDMFDAEFKQIKSTYETSNRKYERSIDREVGHINFFMEEMEKQTTQKRFKYGFHVDKQYFYLLNKRDKEQFQCSKSSKYANLCSAYYSGSPKTGKIEWKEIAQKLRVGSRTPDREDIRQRVDSLKDWSTNRRQNLGVILVLEGDYIIRKQ